MTLVEKAEIFASAAHAAVGQVRKYSGEPYRVHLATVAALVRIVVLVVPLVLPLLPRTHELPGASLDRLALVDLLSGLRESPAGRSGPCGPGDRCWRHRIPL